MVLVKIISDSINFCHDCFAVFVCEDEGILFVTVVFNIVLILDIFGTHDVYPHVIVKPHRAIVTHHGHLVCCLHACDSLNSHHAIDFADILH